MANIALGIRKEATEPGFIRSVLAEMILTFIFVFTVVGSAITAGRMVGGADSIMGLTAVAATNSMVVAVMIAAGIDMSAGHLNPAVTIGMAAGGYITFFRSILYVIVQLIGSSVACLLLKYLTGPDVPIQTLAAGTDALRGVVMEAVLTFTMVLSIYAIVVKPTKGIMSGLGPVLIGLIVGANNLAAGPFTGPSMNPARSFGPALVSWNWTNHWVYWVGPLIGSGLAGFVYDHVFVSSTHNPVPRDEEQF